MNNTENDYLPTDLGNVSLNPRGEYDPETAYEYLDTVSYQGGSYVCRIENGTTITGAAPEPGRNTDIWQMLTLPGNLRPDYIAMYDDVVNKAAQVEISRAAVEQAQQEVEAAQADVQQLHEDTLQTAQEAENSRDSAAGYAQSAEASRKAAAESEQNINAQMTGLDQKVSESVSKATGDIATARQQAIDTITTQEAKSTAEVKRVGTAALDSAKQASQDIKTAGQQAVRAITDQQNISVQAVKDETKNYIEEKKQEISDKTDEVTQAVEQAGEKQLQNIANSLDNTLTESGKAADSKAVGDAITLIEENKANKSALATTDRKLDALWKLNQGITYEFQTDNAEAYQKTIPTGAKVASVKLIGGKTIVWNQLLQPYTNYVSYDNAHTKVSYEDDCAILTVIDVSTPNRYSYGFVYPSNYTVVPNHKYYISASLCASKGCTVSCEYVTNSGLQLGTLDSNTWTKLSTLYTSTDALSKKGLLYMNDNSVGDTLKAKNMMIVDLTKMFGSGNEPSTPEEFEAMFPTDYYPYNVGELMSASVNEVIYLDTKNKETSYPIPQAILNLPGYGWSVGDVRNEVNWENKQHIQRVNAVDLGTLNWGYMTGYTAFMANVSGKADGQNMLCSMYINYGKASLSSMPDMYICANSSGKLIFIKNSKYTDADAFKQAMNGVMLYYKFAESIITDISDIVDNTFQEPVEVEAGGTLTFKNSHGDDYRIPVPSSEEYVISLAEVGK